MMIQQGQINKHYNAHKGKPILIAGCGPSMTDETALKIKESKIVTIGVNKCFMYDDMGFNPTYHIFNDHSTDFIYVYQEVLKELSQKGTKLVMPAQVHPEYRKGIDDPLLYWLADFKKRYNFYTYNNNQDVVWFSRGLTIVFTALQLAVYLGASSICLIGVDFKLTEDNRVHNFDTHSLPVKAAKRMNDEAFPFRMKHIEDIAAPALANLDIDVYNLSKKSRLECFVKPDNTLEASLKWLSLHA
jgi:hypothetical protein